MHNEVWSWGHHEIEATSLEAVLRYTCHKKKHEWSDVQGLFTG